MRTFKRFKDSFTRTVNIAIFRNVKDWVQHSLVALFTLDIKEIKGAAHKNGDFDGTCKQALSIGYALMV